MLYTYEQLKELKNNGNKLNWNEISKEQLEYLFINDAIPNSLIADLYDVSPSQVYYKRKKWNILLYSAKYLYQSFENNNKNQFDKLNNDSKERIMQNNNIDRLAKALTHYIFRNGPIEDMHANNQLSQDDMKTLNKYMVNKLANVISLAINGEWLKIELLVQFLSLYGTDWDKAEIDTSDIDLIFYDSLNR